MSDDYYTPIIYNDKFNNYIDVFKRTYILTYETIVNG